jgi:hypothetical protein
VSSLPDKPGEGKEVTNLALQEKLSFSTDGEVLNKKHIKKMKGNLISKFLRKGKVI